MRKRRVLSSVDGNLISKPPMRRLESEGDFSLESWEERALADSKTPKTSNVGGTSFQQPTTKRRKAHRRPPLPTRPKHGGLGSSIIDPSRRTPRKLPHNGGISSRWSPKRESPDRTSRKVDQMTPSFKQPVVLPRREVVDQKVQSMSKAMSPTDENLRSAVPYATTGRGDLHGTTTKINGNGGRASTQVAGRSVSFAPMKESSSPDQRTMPGDRDDSPPDEVITKPVQLFQKATSGGATDDDMNCDSSEESTLLNSSDSSVDSKEQNAAGTSENVPSSSFLDRLQATTESNNDRKGHIPNSGVCQEWRKMTKDENDHSAYEKHLDLWKDNGFQMNDDNGLDLVGATVGTTHFEQQDLEEDTDVTDMTSLSSYDEDSSMASNEDNDVDDIQKEIAEPQREGCCGSKTARRLTFDKISPASASETSVEDSSEPAEEESIEAWSVTGYTNSPILFKIGGKKYIHPPLPAGWRIKISKTHNRPIYIHPDIGRTFHCPVDLPRDVVYVRRKDGTLVKRAKTEVKIATGSPRASGAPDTPPSITQESPESCFTSLSPQSIRSDASDSNFDSTIELIHGALQHAKLCLKSSTRNMKRAKQLMNESRDSPRRNELIDTPSTMSDVLRLYACDRTEKHPSATIPELRLKGGDDCDILLDSGRSHGSSSSLRSSKQLGGGKESHKVQSQNIVFKKLSTVLESSTPAEDFHGEHRELRPAPQDHEFQHRNLSNALKSVSAKDQLEDWYTPNATNDPGDQPPSHCAVENSPGRSTKRTVPESAKGLAHGEYIDGWFTPKVREVVEKQEFEKVAVLRHSAKRSRSGDAIINSSTRKRTNQKLEGPTPFPLRIETSRQATAKKAAASLSKEKSLLPFFDIFKKQLSDAEDESRHDDGDEETFDNGPDAQTFPKELENHLSSWKSPDCLDIPESSLEKEKSVLTPDNTISPRNSPEKLEGRNKVIAIALEAQSTIKSAEKRSSPNNKVTSNHAKGASASIPNREKDKSLTEKSDAATAAQAGADILVPGKAAVSMSKKDKNDKKSVTFETPSLSDIEFPSGGDGSPEISTDGLPDPELDLSPSKEFRESDPSPSITPISKQNVDYPEEPNNDDSTSDISSVGNDDNIEGSGGGHDADLSSVFLTIKRRRMSWRVLNPSYPRCSLQRLDEIAKTRAKKKKAPTALPKRNAKGQRSVPFKKERQIIAGSSGHPL